MPKFTITTLGCKVNQSESAAIAERLEKSGWNAVAKKKPSDLCIINTCTVTQKASMQSRQAVRQAIRSNPNARIMVTGCYAQTEPEEIKKIDGVDLIIGHTDKHNIPDMVLSPGQNDLNHPVLIQGAVQNTKDFVPAPVSTFGGRTRPFLKIQDGCNAFCTYCIVPYARGRSRSMPPDSVLKNIKQLERYGYREVVLSGVHLGGYGLDLSPQVNLFDLLNLIHQANLIDRVRLSSIEPHELTDDIIQLVAESGRFCRHFHIPLQSGDDQILQNMQRPYSCSYFKDLIYKIHKLIPDAAIGVDILMGFPGETQTAFENTCDLIKELPVSYLHVFPFSSRKRTPASNFPDKVPAKVIQSRCRQMRDLGYTKKEQFYKKHIGRTVEVLIESKRDNRSGFLKGISSNYLRVLIDGDDVIKNAIVRAKIERLFNNDSLLCTISSQA